MSASSSVATLQSLQPGSSFGSYDVVRCIGMGGMGAVFEATHRLLDRRVALKVMLGDTRDGADMRERFLREGAALVRVKHPNVVTVYDAGIVDGMPFLAMELLAGLGLDRVIEREGRLAPARAVALLAPIADGLSAVHAAGLVHRDVKSENLFVTLDSAGREVVKLIDFGIAKEASRSGVRNTVIGTPHYMPPEQLFGGEVLDGRADQYSLSVVLYEALTGVLPYDGNSVLDLAMNVERGGAAAPSVRNDLIPASLDAVVLQGLAREVSDRFGTMEEFHGALLDSVPFGISPMRATPGTASLALGLEEDVERSREFPTMIEPLAPTLPPPREANQPTDRFESELPPPAEDRRLVIALALGVTAVLAVVIGLALARMRLGSDLPAAAPVVQPVTAPPSPPASNAALAPAAADTVGAAVPTETANTRTEEATAESTTSTDTSSRRARRGARASNHEATPAPATGQSIRLTR